MLLDKIELHKVRQVLKKVNKWAPTMRQMSDAELQNQTKIFQKELKQGRTLEQILPRAYATVREADYRLLGLYPYDVQVMGAIILNQGNIAEMKTGEGKTLTATMPMYLNALTKKGAILVTPNSYLAERDEKQLAPVYRWLGLTVSTGFRTSDDKEKGEPSPREKRKWYNSDILYTTSDLLAFDYLFNNLASSEEGQYLRPYNYALVDEVDAVLLDGATSPFVVATDPTLQSNMYELADNFVVSLVPQLDYRVKKRESAIWLTYHGVRKAERYFRLDNLYAIENRELYRHIALAMRARHFMRNGHDYLVRDGKVVLLDESDGRIMKGIQIGSGIQQAVEQKEHVNITNLEKTAASVTYPSLFGLFNKISGMSGTAKTNENEFINSYGMKVIQVPTNKPVIRKDLPDKLYLTTSDKLMAALDQVRRLHAEGRPVLMVAGSVENSEILSELLLNQGIPHNVLNAFNASREAAMVKEAGQEGAVTIATNMAGRGTDIKLAESVRKKGGLAVIGTEMLPERVKLQLAGRAGRQGDPGTSQFYISMEDSFISQGSTQRFQNYYRSLIQKRKAGKQITRLHGPRIHFSLWMLKNRIAGGQEMSRISINKFEMAQKIQRQSYYAVRKNILNTRHLEALAGKWISQAIDIFLAEHDHWSRHQLQMLMSEHFTYNMVTVPKGLDNKGAIKRYLEDFCREQLTAKFKVLITSEQLNQFYRSCLLSALDGCWTDEIDYLTKLRTYVGPYGMAGQDPGFIYNERALTAYEKMLKKAKCYAVNNLMLSTISLNDKNELVMTMN